MNFFVKVLLSVLFVFSSISQWNRVEGYSDNHQQLRQHQQRHQHHPRKGFYHLIPLKYYNSVSHGRSVSTYSLNPLRTVSSFRSAVPETLPATSPSGPSSDPSLDPTQGPSSADPSQNADEGRGLMKKFMKYFHQQPKESNNIIIITQPTTNTGTTTDTGTATGTGTGTGTGTTTTATATGDSAGGQEMRDDNVNSQELMQQILRLQQQQIEYARNDAKDGKKQNRPILNNSNNKKQQQQKQRLKRKRQQQQRKIKLLKKQLRKQQQLKNTANKRKTNNQINVGGSSSSSVINTNSALSFLNMNPNSSIQSIMNAFRKQLPIVRN